MLGMLRGWLRIIEGGCAQRRGGRRELMRGGHGEGEMGRGEKLLIVSLGRLLCVFVAW